MSVFKRLILPIFLFFVYGNLVGQVANTGIYFQAIARDNYANPAKDRNIYVVASIIQQSATGVVVLKELHKTTTDGAGVFSISLGNGSRIGGTVNGLNNIEWAKGPYYLGLQIAIQPISPVQNWDYTKEMIDLGASPFGTVPYALYSGSSGALNDKLSISDTAKMLAIYAKAQIVNNLASAVDSKISSTDTATMLAPYRQMVNALVESNITSLTAARVNAALDSKVNLADSLTTYVTPTQLKTKTFDSTSIYKQLADHQTAINSKLNIEDSLTKYVTLTQLNAKTFDSTAIYNQLATKANTASVTTLLATKEELSNKSTNVTMDATSDTKYPSVKAIKTYVDAQALAASSGTLNFNTPLSQSGVNISISQANASTNGFITAADYTAFTNKIDATQKAANNGVATLGNDGKIPSNQIPAISFQSANVVTSQVQMLGLNSAVVGSIAIRTDLNKNFVLSETPATTLSNWIELATPTSVTSINGFAGPNVVLTTNDIATSTNKNYVTNIQSGVLSNTSGTNTGDETATTIKTKLGITTLSGANTGDQTITLTGDVTGSGTGSFTTTVNSLGGVSSATIATLPSSIASHAASITSNTNAIAIEATTARAAELILTNNVNANTSSITTMNSALNAKADIANPTFTGTVSGITKSMVGLGDVENTALSTWTGSNNITNLGTINSGTWSGTVIGNNVGGAGTVNGLLKANGSGLVSAAVAGTDYQAPITTASTTGQFLTSAAGGTYTWTSASSVSGVPYTGAIGAVNLGAYDLMVNGLTIGLGTGNISTNTAIGNSALLANAANSGRNTAVGFEALKSNTSSKNNTALGYRALYTFNDIHSINGYGENTAIGSGALYSATTGSSNTALGNNALYGNTTAQANVGLGTDVLTRNTTGSFNVGVGASVLSNVTSGRDNTVLGYNAGSLYGSGAGANLSNLTQGILIGSGARTRANSSTNEIAIGYGVVGNGSNTVTVGNLSNTATYFTGDINLTGNINGGTWSGTVIGSNYGGAGTVNGLLKANGSGVVSAALAGTDYMAANAATTLTGDVSGSGNGSFVTTINSVGGVSSSTISGFDSRITNNTNDIALRATIASPSFTGTPTAVTAAPGTNSTQLATTAFVSSAISSSGTGVPYTGAIGAVNLGAYDLTVNGLTIGKGAGGKSDNTVLGVNALLTNSTGNYNTAIGTSALKAATAGYNTAIGNSALYQLTSGTYNTAIGYATLATNTDKARNTAVGSQSMRKNAGNYNTALGESSLYGYANSPFATGDYNTAIGYQTLENVTTAANNVALGAQALNNLTGGNDNTVIGYNSGVLSGTGSATTNLTQGILIGSGAKTNANNSTNEVAIGYGVVGNGSNTVTVGNLSNTATYFKGDINLTGNIKGGTWSGTAIDITKGGTGLTSPGASGNVLTSNGTSWVSQASTNVSSLGTFTTTSYANGGAINGTVLTLSAADALNPGLLTASNQTIGGAKTFSNTTTFNTDVTVNGVKIGRGNLSQNTILGASALNSSTGNENTGVGYYALKFNSSGSRNTAVGSDAMGRSTVTGVENTAVGASAMSSNSSGSNNTAVGSKAMSNNAVTGSNNQAFGFRSLYNNNSGYGNSAYGNNSLYENTSGYYNTAIGYNALYGNSVAITGSENVGLGNSAVWSISSGSNNIGIGTNSLGRITTTSNNIAIGYQAGYFYAGSTGSASNIANSVFIGHDVRPAGVSDNNEIVISGYTGTAPGTIGLGTNTTSLGNANTTRAVIYGSTSLSNLPATASSGNGGDFTLKAQDAFTTGNNNGGNINLSPGAANGTGTAGNVQINGQIKITGGTPGVGKVLTSDANGLASWTAPTGVSSVGTFTTTSYANGATISGTTLTLAAADATNPGLISTNAQTIVGTKTFSSTTTNFNGQIKIVDGTQYANKVLTSDADGLATWANPLPSAQFATLSNSTNQQSVTLTANGSVNTDNYLYTYITLPVGKWDVNFNILSSAVGTATTGSWWVRMGLSTSSTSLINNTSDFPVNRLVSGRVSASNSSYDMIQGHIIVNNTSGSAKTYYLWTGQCDLSGADGSSTLQKFTSSSYGENLIFALPMY